MEASDGYDSGQDGGADGYDDAVQDGVIAAQGADDLGQEGEVFDDEGAEFFDEDDDDSGGLFTFGEEDENPFEALRPVIDQEITRALAAQYGIDPAVAELAADEMSEEIEAEANAERLYVRLGDLERRHPELTDPDVGQAVIDETLRLCQQHGREEIVGTPAFADVLLRVFKSRRPEQWASDKIQERVARAGGATNLL